VRARLDHMAASEEFHFLCNEIMADKMDRVVALAGGEILNKDVREYGVVVSVRKKFNSG
jgi:hypothetical protein